MHKIGDLVYHREILGYVESFGEKIYKNDSFYYIRWLNPRIEDDVSMEWELDVSKMKEEFNERINRI